MRNILAFVSAGVMSFAAIAQIPVVGGPIDSQLPAMQQVVQAMETNKLLMQQLELMNASMPARGRGCFYENKIYSEGAIIAAEKVKSICTEREWGIIEKSGPRELVWEPIASARLRTYREATRLPTN